MTESRRSLNRYILFLLLATWAVAGSVAAQASETVDLVLGGEPFRLELAADPASRARGLMFRESIAADGGMLFVFPDSRPRGFWMKNCLVNMDIVFLDAEGVVVRTLEMFAEPLQRQDESVSDYHRRLPGYRSREPAQFAIELRHGTVPRLGIAVGDRLIDDPASLVARAR
jgi:uncharacterized membrane protein (UPF0127 family)